jgi:hypothetical protein
MRRLTPVKLVLENLPPSLRPQRDALAQCLEAMNRALPLRQAILFESHARGQARPDSDVDLCLVPDAALGPVVLEANARPGLAIQIANGRGVLPRLRFLEATACRVTAWVMANGPVQSTPLLGDEPSSL